MEIIKVNGLCKTFGEKKAVDNISFTVDEGSLFGFLGENGAGKSTTINIISTTITQSSGEAEICGYKLGKDDISIRNNIGIVYQNNCLDGILTVKENLIFRGSLYSKSRSEITKRYSDVCDILSLGDISDIKYSRLSGGQKRRCEIAAALMNDPKILFLDEPTTGLDPATRKNVWNAIGELQKQMKLTVFLTTHYMEEAANADKIVILDKGRICAQGTPFELKEKYAYDTLKLYTKNDISALLEDRKANRTEFGYVLHLNGTMNALDILGKVRDRIDGFEVIGGNMDDVFMNVTTEETL